MGMLEVDVRMRRVLVGNCVGRTCRIEVNRSASDVDAGKGRHSVGGSDRPGKESNRTLTTGSILRQQGRQPDGEYDVWQGLRRSNGTMQMYSRSLLLGYLTKG